MGSLNIPGVDFIDAGSNQPDCGRWLLHGPQGSGKSTLASTIAQVGKTLYLDFVGEKGTRSFQGASYAGNIDVARPTSITALDDLFYALDSGDHDYKAVVIDSLTSVQKMTMRYLTDQSETAVREIKQGGKPTDIRTWGQSLDIMVDTATFWYGLADGNREKPMHVVMTAQTKIQENDLTQEVMRQPDVQKGALSIVCATPDYIVYTDIEENDEHMIDDSVPPTRHVARFGSHPGYVTKARVPVNLRGKIPPILGRKNPTDLVALSRVLNIGGIPPKPKATPAKK